MTSTYTVCPKCNKVNRIDMDLAKSKTPICGSCKTEVDFHDGVTHLSTEQLQKLIRTSPIPVVVDFWAPWCGPCRSFAPTFKSMAHKKRGEFVFVKINTEENQDAGSLFSIRGIPTVTAFKSGSEIQRQSGALPEPHFEKWLSQLAP